jgi:hypothetical protein
LPVSVVTAATMLSTRAAAGDRRVRSRRHDSPR